MFPPHRPGPGCRSRSEPSTPASDSHDAKSCPTRPGSPRNRGLSANCKPSNDTIRTAPPASSAGPATRRAADPPAQVTQRLRRRTDHRHPGQTRGQLVPDEAVAELGEQAHRQQEVDLDPRRQITEPSPYRPRLRKDRVHELERHDGSQLAQMPGSEPARGHGDRTGDSRQRRRQDTMTGQRNSFGTSCLGRLPVPTSSVALR